MAAPMKKKRVGAEELANISDASSSDFDDDDVMSDGEDREEEEDMAGQEVQVDFEARTPEDSDFHGIRKLLQQLFLKANINISDFADTILAQNYVGSVLKQVTVDDDDDSDDEEDGQEVFGVVTVINISEKKDMEFVKQLRSILLDRCKQPNVRAKMADMFNAEGSMGFIINERFINMPPQIALPSFESLWSEVEKASNKRMPYKFDRYVMICKTYRLPEVTQQPQNEPPMFTNQEEEYFYQNSTLCYNYSVAEEKDAPTGGTWDDDDDQFEPMRTVIVFSAEKLPVIMSRLSDVLSQ